MPRSQRARRRQRLTAEQERRRPLAWTDVLKLMLDLRLVPKDEPLIAMFHSMLMETRKREQEDRVPKLKNPPCYRRVFKSRKECDST